MTIVGAECTINMNTHSKDAQEVARAIAETLVPPPSNEYVHGGEPWLVLGPEHAAIFARSGMSRQEVKRALWQASRMPARRLTGRGLQRARDSRAVELGAIDIDTMLPIAKCAEDIMIILAGGPGTRSIYVPCFGNSRAVTRAIPES